MPLNKFSGDIFPNHKQLLLLKAGLETGDTALSAWKEWKTYTDIEKIDGGSFKLLPLAYKNISNLGISDPLLSRIKGVYRYTWTKNQLLLAFAANIVNILNQAHVNSIILKGVALIADYYKDIGIRSMGDVDILVPRKQVHQAIEILCNTNISPEVIYSKKNYEELSQLIHATNLKNKNNLRLDLHWSILPELCGTHLSQEITSNQKKIQLPNKQVAHTLATEEMLFHICIHGTRHNPSSPIRWISDAHYIIKNTTNINWRRIADTAIKCKLTLPMIETLSYLEENFKLDIPQKIITELMKVPVTKADKNAYHFNKYNNLLFLPINHWLRYKRLIKQSDNKQIGFLHYLKYYFGKKYIWQLPLTLLVKFIKKCFE